jgi:enolase-phosphatase E1
MSEAPLHFNVRAVLTDIEGTTSSIAFVHEVMFPFARARLADFVAAQSNNPAVQEQLAATLTLAHSEGDAREDAVAILLDWIAQDRKATPLKALQGIIWKDGFESGELVSDVFADAIAQLRAWHQAGIPLYVYSSGSIQAQKLYFGHTAEGDLTPLFSGYFDTTSGAKTEATSYQRIATTIGIAPEQILFLSDLVKELNAATDAGLQTVQIVRAPAKPDPSQTQHPQRVSFSDLQLPSRSN